MKRNHIIIIMLLLIISLVLMSCNPSDDTDTEEPAVAADNSDNEEVNEESDNTSTDTITEEPEADEVTNEGEIDISLFDKALLASYKINPPDTMTAKYSEISRFSFSESEEEVEDILATLIHYLDGENSRMETIDELGTDVSIYVADEETTYEYTEDDAIGFKYEEDSSMDMKFQDYEGKTLLEMFENLIEVYATELEMDMELRADREKFAGRKTIRIEFVVPEETLLAREASGEDLGMEIDGPFTIFTFWIDQEYTAMVGMEMKFGDTWYMYQEATEIEFNKKVNKNLFVPPSDITFELEEW